MLDPMDCLRDGVPPLLLIDLFGEAGPDAEHIYVDEPAEDLSWTHPIADGGAHDAAEVAGQLPMHEVTPSPRDLVPDVRPAAEIVAFGQSAPTA